MNNRIAKFEKVSFVQFKKDWIDTFGDASIDTFEDASMGTNLLDIYNLIRKPQRATTDSAGYDILAPIHIILEPGRTMKIPTGLRCNVEPGWFMAITPRSGLGFKYAVRMANTLGIIDRDYFYSDNEGHIFIKLVNDSCICKTVDIPQGKGMAQAIFLPYGITVDDNADGTRNGGFGSTDKEN